MVQEVAEFGKARADLRNEQLRKVLHDLEKKRDGLLDEIAYRKGQSELLEDIIKDLYDRMLAVNREEQAEDQRRVNAQVEVLKKQAEEEEERIRQEAAAAAHAEKQKKRRAKKHPSDRAKDVQKRKAEAKKG